VTLPRQPEETAPAGAVFISAPGEAWTRQLRYRIGHLWVLKMLSTMGAIAAFFYAYFWVMRHPLAEMTVMPLTWLDRVIGFEPLSFPLYVFLWVYVSLGTALARDLRELAAFGLASLAMSLVGFAVFMLMPTRVPDFAIDWSLHPSLEFLKQADVGGNAFPSLHAAFRVFAACVLHASTKVCRSMRPVATPWVWTSATRSCTEGMPLGILVKSLRPMSFWPWKSKGAWSVPMVLIARLAIQFHRGS